MRYVICDYSGHPFQVELSRCLAARGHDVLHVHYAGFQTPKGKLAVFPDDPVGFNVAALRTAGQFNKGDFLRRRFLESRVGTLAAARALAFRPDVVVGCNMPLDAQNRLKSACTQNGIPFVFWLQDIYSHAIHHYLSAKLGVLGSAVGQHYKRLEGRLLRTSDAVVAISTKFRASLELWGVDRERVSVIPNWAPLSEISPIGKDNEWARSHGLSEKLVALYTGTLGLKHDPRLLLELAKRGNNQGLTVVVISEGAAAQWLAERKREEGVGNLVLLPFQPMELYPQVLGAGDIMLAMVDEEAAKFSVPSKILSYIAAGKPIVASIAEDNDAAVTIAAAHAGIVVAPSNPQALFAAVMTLAADPERRRCHGSSARSYAETQFEIDGITDQFERMFAAALRPRLRQQHLAPATVA